MPGTGVPNSRPNSARWARAHWRNARQAAVTFALMLPPAAVPARSMAASISSASSPKMSPHTFCSRSSWLPKYRYSAGAVIPMSRAMARRVTASGPLETRIFRAVCLISTVVSARTRSRLLSASTMDASSLRSGTRPPGFAESPLGYGWPSGKQP